MVSSGMCVCVCVCVFRFFSHACPPFCFRFDESKEALRQTAAALQVSPEELDSKQELWKLTQRIYKKHRQSKKRKARLKKTQQLGFAGNLGLSTAHSLVTHFPSDQIPAFTTPVLATAKSVIGWATLGPLYGFSTLFSSLGDFTKLFDLDIGHIAKNMIAKGLMIINTDEQLLEIIGYDIDHAVVEQTTSIALISTLGSIVLMALYFLMDSAKPNKKLAEHKHNFQGKMLAWKYSVLPALTQDLIAIVKYGFRERGEERGASENSFSFYGHAVSRKTILAVARAARLPLNTPEQRDSNLLLFCDHVANAICNNMFDLDNHFAVLEGMGAESFMNISLTMLEWAYALKDKPTYSEDATRDMADIVAMRLRLIHGDQDDGEESDDLILEKTRKKLAALSLQKGVATKEELEASKNHIKATKKDLSDALARARAIEPRLDLRAWVPNSGKAHFLSKYLPRKRWISLIAISGIAAYILFLMYTRLNLDIQNGGISQTAAIEQLFAPGAATIAIHFQVPAMIEGSFGAIGKIKKFALAAEAGNFVPALLSLAADQLFELGEAIDQMRQNQYGDSGSMLSQQVATFFGSSGTRTKIRLPGAMDVAQATKRIMKADLSKVVETQLMMDKSARLATDTQASGDSWFQWTTGRGIAEKVKQMNKEEKETTRNELIQNNAGSGYIAVRTAINTGKVIAEYFGELLTLFFALLYSCFRGRDTRPEGDRLEMYGLALLENRGEDEMSEEQLFQMLNYAQKNFGKQE